MNIAQDLLAREHLLLGPRLRVLLERRRSRRLVSRRRRRRLVGWLEHLVSVAEQPQRPHGSAVAVNSEEVLRCRGLLYNLAAELDAEAPIAPRGVMLLRELLRDGGSALYAQAPDGTLESELQRAWAALLARQPWASAPSR